MRTIAIVMLVALARAGSATVVVSAGSAGETPAALAQRYDAATVHARGIIGASTRIAVVAESDVSVADLADFRATNGFPAVSVDRVAVAGSVPTADPTMTVLLEWAGALSPGAALTAVVGNAWCGLATAILDDVAPIIVVTDLGAAAPPDVTVDLLVRLLYEQRLITAGQVVVGIPGEEVAQILFNAALRNGQAIIVPAESPIAGHQGVLAVGGTEIRDGGEVAWLASTSPADVAALASPDAPGYVYRWQGSSECCAGGEDLSAAVWSGVAAILRDAGLDSDVQSFVRDAGARQANGGIVAFGDVTAGPPAAPGFDPPTGFGTPRVAGLVAALDCLGVDCLDTRDQGCGRSVCAEGGACKRVAFADGTACNADACTVGGTCEAGECHGGNPVSCEDNGACTVDSCDPDRGCTHAAVSGVASCQVLGASRCVEWLVEADRAASRRIVCSDGDPACDRDDVPGQCTFVTALCVRQGCTSGPIRIVQPTAGRLHAALSRALARRPEAGECTEAAELVLPVGRMTKVRARVGRQRTTIEFVCQAG
jgi:hypothetical protein